MLHHFFFQEVLMIPYCGWFFYHKIQPKTPLLKMLQLRYLQVPPDDS